MPAYRIYWLDKDDHIIAADNLIADADEEARAAAESRLGRAAAIEVWHGARRVARAMAR
jgi:hypothetical protein